MAKILEARGFEPLSSSRSAQTSTCLAGGWFSRADVAPAHCQLSSVHDFDLTNQTRSLRRFASLLSTFSPLAGVAAKTSRSIKPRERDLRDLRLFVLVRFLTRPTNHPRHAACASNDESKPVRPRESTYCPVASCANLAEKSSDATVVCSNVLTLPNAT